MSRLNGWQEIKISGEYQEVGLYLVSILQGKIMIMYTSQRENDTCEKNRSHDFVPIVDDPLLSICLSRFCIIPVV
jgi:hypothetical protein